MVGPAGVRIKLEVMKRAKRAVRMRQWPALRAELMGVEIVLLAARSLPNLTIVKQLEITRPR